MIALIYEVDIKGSFPKRKRDSQTMRRYSDMSRNTYSKLFFRCTKEEFDKIYDEQLSGDESNFKVIGINYYEE